METFIASMIMKAADISQEAGQEKYRSYFLLSTTSGGDYSFCIVKE